MDYLKLELETGEGGEERTGSMDDLGFRWIFEGELRMAAAERGGSGGSMDRAVREDGDGFLPFFASRVGRRGWAREGEPRGFWRRVEI